MVLLSLRPPERRIDPIVEEFAEKTLNSKNFGYDTLEQLAELVHARLKASATKSRLLPKLRAQSSNLKQVLIAKGLLPVPRSDDFEGTLLLILVDLVHFSETIHDDNPTSGSECICTRSIAV